MHIYFFGCIRSDDCLVFSTQAFRPIELKLLSTQDVALYFRAHLVLMRTTGEIVFVRFKENLYLYTLQLDGSLNKKKIKLPCHHYLSLLFIQILWREHLAISCSSCKDIKLLDMETLEVTTAFSDDIEVGKMCRGWHKLFVEVPSGFLELDCSSTKFTKIREIKSGKAGPPDGSDIHYIPPPHKMVVFTWMPERYSSAGGAIHASSIDEPNKTTWHFSDKEVDGKMIAPKCVLYSSRHDALIVLDRENRTVWVLNPGTGEVLQDIEIEINYDFDGRLKGFLWGSQLVIFS